MADGKPDRIDISLWQSLGDDEHRIRVNGVVINMLDYCLVKKSVVNEALELKRIWEERL